MDKVGVGRGALEQNINCFLKRSKRAQMGPKGFLMVKNNYVDHFGPFRTLLDHFGVLTSLPCLVLFGPKWTIFRPSPVMNGRPESEKKAHHHVSYVWAACGTPSLALWNINMAAIYENVKNRSKFHEKMAFFAIILP